MTNMNIYENSNGSKREGGKEYKGKLRTVIVPETTI